MSLADFVLVVLVLSVFAFGIDMHLRRRRLEAAVEKMAVTSVVDPVTGVFSTTAFLERCAGEVNRTEREGRSLMVVRLPNADPATGTGDMALSEALYSWEVAGELTDGGVGVLILDASRTEQRLSDLVERLSAWGLDVAGVSTHWLVYEGRRQAGATR